MCNYEPFVDNWIYPTFEPINNLVWRVSDEAQTKLLIGDLTLKKLLNRQRQAVLATIPRIGNNPYVALSGGIDSQATCLLLLNARIDFVAAIMVFTNNLNEHDVASAIAFCTRYDIKHVLIEFNMLTFLGRELHGYVEKYDCPSPQISAHCKFYEILIERYSPSSIICGGNPPSIRNGKWEFISNRSQSAWMTFALDNKYPLIGNFLGYSLDIALPFMLCQPDMTSDLNQRYQAKVTGMHRLGLRVMPQRQKFTGFELVKEHFAKMSGDGWTFEKCFRLPHHHKRPEYDSILELTEPVSNFLSTQHLTFNNNEQ